MRLAIAALPLALILACLPSALRADEDILKDRPAMSLGDMRPRSVARCDQVRAMTEGVTDPGYRIDLAATGPLTLVRTDGALWYLVICSDVRIMCVTYQGNDMKVGDVVTFGGSYRRLDPRHIVLDPCLAHAGAPESDGANDVAPAQ